MLSFYEIPYKYVNTEDRLHFRHWYNVERDRLLKKADRHIQRIIFSVFGLLCLIYLVFSTENDFYRAGQLVRDLLPVFVCVPTIICICIGIYVVTVIRIKDKESKWLITKSSLMVGENNYFYNGDYLIDTKDENNKLQPTRNEKNIIWSDNEVDRQYKIYKARYKDGYKYYVIKRVFEY